VHRNATVRTSFLNAWKLLTYININHAQASRRLELDLVEMLNQIPKTSEEERRAKIEHYLFADGKNVIEYWNRMVEFTKYLEEKTMEKDVSKSVGCIALWT